MIYPQYNYDELFNSPARSIKARVELLDGSTLLETFNYDGALKEFSINRVGESSKFFGFGVCQGLVVKLRDTNRTINIVKGNGLEVAIGSDSEFIYPFPIFFVDSVERDETTNTLTVTAYDAIYKAEKHYLSEVTMTHDYTIEAFTNECAAFLGLPVVFNGIEEALLDTYYPTGANFEKTETVRRALDTIADTTQSIYFVNHDWELEFKRLDRSGAAVMTIDKSKYFTLTASEAHTLQNVVHVTELGDNVSASSGITGDTQYVRNNPFWELREDIGTIVENALEAVQGLTITQFECKWRGDFRLEIGDKINVTTKNDNVITSYLLNDVITYNGGMHEKSTWLYTSSEGETASNPSTLGEALRMTYAKVDKVNKQIDLVVSEVAETEAKVSMLQLTTDSISASVELVQANSTQMNDSLSSEIEELSQKVNATMSPEDIQIEITKAVNNGATKVSTTTGYTFDDNGLTISKTGTEISTQITEDGMTISRSGTEMLIADSTGVKATNLHATTYLHIGTYSRMEDYGERTGCFWIGE